MSCPGIEGGATEQRRKQKKDKPVAETRCLSQPNSCESKVLPPRRHVSHMFIKKQSSFVAIEAVAPVGVKTKACQRPQRNKQYLHDQDVPRWGQGVGWVRTGVEILPVAQTLADVGVPRK